MGSKDKLNNNNSWHKDIPLTSLGWDLALPIFGGVFLGYQIDHRLGSSYTFTLALLLIGVVIAYYNLYKLIQLEILRTKSAKLKNLREDQTR